MKPKKIKNLTNALHPDFLELKEWLIKNVGPDSDSPYSTGSTQFGENFCWEIYCRFEADGPWKTVQQWYVKFDSRKVKRHQMTWFNLKWK